jgi:AcrR family transcriptional regulator
VAPKFDESAVPPPPWSKARRAAAPVRQPLTRALIIETALGIVDREGLDGLSMRRVAQELNTGPATLYAHVANKDDLLQLLLDRVSSEIELPEPDPQRWQEQLRDLLREVHRILNEHGDIARVALGSVPTGPNTLRVSDRMLGILITGGVPPHIAGWAIDRLFLYVSADSFEGSLHVVRQRATGQSTEEYYTNFVGQLRGYFASLPPEHYPYIAAHVDDLVSGGDDRFEFGLDLLIQGIASHARKR